MAKKSKSEVSLTEAEKQAIQTELGLSSKDLQVDPPYWAYAAGSLILLLSAAMAVKIVRG